MVKKLTQIESVLEALEIIGCLSSIGTLKAKAEEFYGGYIHETTVYSVRGEWKKANGIEADCRSYASQPRRNMLNDDYMSLSNQLSAKKLMNLITDFDPFEKLLADFHSLEHMVNCVKKVRRKRKVA